MNGTRVAFLATGDEIVCGDTLNSTSRYFANQLASEGFITGRHLACSDSEEDIIGCMEFLGKNHDVLIITGGLGPTSDDRTRFALAHWLNVSLHEFPEAREHLTHHLRNSGFALNAGNLQQCLFPEGSTLLPNPNGTALGAYGFWNGRHIVLLPGPPREALPMFDNHALKLLQNCQRTDSVLLKWRLFGVAESVLNQTMEEALKGVPCEIGYRLDSPYIEFKVRTSAEMVERVRAIVDPICKPLILTPDGKKASELLREAIVAHKIPLSIRDDVTGGVLESLLHTPDTHPWLSFQPSAHAAIQVHLQGLEAFWNSQPNVQETTVQVRIESANTKWQDMHTLPFRSAMVVLNAAEWLSFRILHGLNLLHQ